MTIESSYFNCVQCCNLGAQLCAYQQDTSPKAQLIRKELEKHQDTARGRALLSILDEESIFGNSMQDRLIVSEGRAVCLECDASQPSLALYLTEKFPENFR